MGHERDCDSDMAKRIATDTSFRGDLEYTTTARRRRRKGAPTSGKTAARHGASTCYAGARRVGGDRDFMKYLIRTQWARDRGVLFFEQVVSFRWYHHMAIDYAKNSLQEALNAAGEEWSQHLKIIDTAKHVWLKQRAALATSSKTRRPGRVAWTGR
ncbi:hypothetical protein HK405_015339 [Cladochytrium tenue]|nr:hypothetical protein HK405_015339 [Cladochytrium tenue]